MIDWTLSVTRLLQFASILMLFGSAVFCLYGRELEAIGVPRQHWAWPRSVLLVAPAVGIVATFGWLMAEAESLTGTWTSWGAVLMSTRFGAIACVRAALLGLLFVAALIWPPAKGLWMIATVIGGVVVASFAWTGHGSIGIGSARLLHRGADVLHLLAAGVWVGALLALSIMVVRSLQLLTPADTRSIAHGLARFSAIGPSAVSILTLTGLVNSWYLVGLEHWRALFNTPYGLALIAKLVLFVLMLTLAAIHRFWLAPQLQATLRRSASAADVLGQLRVSLIAESALAVLVLAAVAVLGTLEPPVSVA